MTSDVVHTALLPLLRMTEWPSAWFSGPFEPEEVRRLLDLVDERLRLRAATGPPGQPTNLLSTDPEPGADEDPAATFEGESLRSFTAPLFNQDKGGEFARAAKRLLNIPLGILGRPQLHFNEALRRVVRSWADVLGATLDNLAALQREASALRTRLAALEAKLEALDRRGETSEPPARMTERPPS